MARFLPGALAGPPGAALLATLGVCAMAAGCSPMLLRHPGALRSPSVLFREETKSRAFREAVEDDAFPTAAQVGMARCE